MTLWRIATPVVVALVTITPSRPLNAIVLPAPGTVPPMVLLGEVTWMPNSELPSAPTPVAVVPM